MTKMKFISALAILSLPFSFSFAKQADNSAAERNSAQAAKTTPLADSQYDLVHKYVIGEEAKWTQVNWMSDLWEARIEAAKKRKPIFIWAMNGDPLGCV